jgi:hypothetical protein
LSPLVHASVAPYHELSTKLHPAVCLMQAQIPPSLEQMVHAEISFFKAHREAKGNNPQESTPLNTEFVHRTLLKVSHDLIARRGGGVQTKTQ